MQLLQLPGEQCNQQSRIHSGAVVATAWISGPSESRGYLLCSCCNSGNSSALQVKRLLSMQLLKLQGEYCSRQTEILSGAAVSTDR